MEQVWVVEWSDSQQCYHIDLLTASVCANIKKHTDNTPTDWVIVGVALSQDKAHELQEGLEVIRSERMKQLFSR